MLGHELMYTNQIQKALAEIRKFDEEQDVDADADEKRGRDARLQEHIAACQIPYPRYGSRRDREYAPLNAAHTHFLLIDDGDRSPHAWYREVEMRADIEAKICELHRVPGVQIVLQGGWGTFCTVRSALKNGCQVVLIEDSDGAAAVLAELVKDLLRRAAELPRENFVRKKAVQRRLEEFRARHTEQQVEMRLHLREESLGGPTSEERKQLWVDAEEICMNLERIVVFSFETQVSHMADTRVTDVKRPFDQVVLDAIVQSAKLEGEKQEQEEERRRKGVAFMRPAGHPVHLKSRGYHPEYPKRFPVVDTKVEWGAPWPEYKPVPFEHPSLAEFARQIDADPKSVPKKWADPAEAKAIRAELEERITIINSPEFGEKVEQRLVEVCEFDEHGRPRNPRGRTGIQGRGLLGKFGPNHAADPIVTRFNPESGRLQMVAIRRKDTGEWAIPGGMVDAGELVSETLRREFGEEAAANDEGRSTSSKSDDKRAVKNRQAREVALEELFSTGGTMVYCGYVDDPRTTDNAWIETTAMHFHCNEKQALALYLSEGSDAEKAIWLDVDPVREQRYCQLYASHKRFVDRVACAFRGHKETMRNPKEFTKLKENGAERLDPQQYSLVSFKLDRQTVFVSPWSAPIDYKPPDFTHHSVYEQYEKQQRAAVESDSSVSSWADPDMDGNDLDADDLDEFVKGLERRETYEGPVMFDHENRRPLNPRGRTGLQGRGMLGRWGPNHACDLLLTRDHPVTRKLQIVVVKRSDATEMRRSSVPKREYTKSVSRMIFTRKPSAPPSPASKDAMRPPEVQVMDSHESHLSSPNSAGTPVSRAQSSPWERAGRKVRSVAKVSNPRWRTVPPDGAENTWAFPGKLIDEVPNLQPRQTQRVTVRGGMMLSDELIETLHETFVSEAFAWPVGDDGGDKSSQQRFEQKRFESRVERVKEEMRELGRGAIVYAGYVDDPRNTDNAWIETAVVHMHCPFALGLELVLQPGEHVNEAIWLDVDALKVTEPKFYANHHE